MFHQFPIEYELSNGTKVLVKKINNSLYEFHLTRLNGMKHNFNWADALGIIDAETATALPRESFTQEESEAISIFRKMQQ
jgi:hypothetical protein